MALWFNDTYFTVWDKRKNDSGTVSLLISNSSKNKAGEWNQDFRGWATLAGAAKPFANVQLPDSSENNARPVRIKANGYMRNHYDKEYKKTMWYLTLTRIEALDAPNNSQSEDDDDWC